jgi:hypothetical protein
MPDAGATLPIIITGTIVPQSNFVHIVDWQVRKQQYLEALRYFCADYRVIFLENSAYDFAADNSFEMPNLSVVKLRDQDAAGFERGKGYQEFKMLDAYLAREDAPRRFMKLSGRRTLKQIGYFQRKYADSRYQWFDLWQNDRFADTSFFCCDLDFYNAHLRGLYAQANDGAGIIIERVVYDALESVPNVRFHPITPLYEGQHGTSGNRLKGKRHIPTEMRRLFRALMGKTKLDKRIFDW